MFKKAEELKQFLTRYTVMLYGVFSAVVVRRRLSVCHGCIVAKRCKISLCCYWSLIKRSHTGIGFQMTW